MEADLDERTRKFEKITSATYFLIIKTKEGKQEIELGRYLKDCPQDLLPEYFQERQSLAGKLEIDCNPPTPAFLQYFSSKQITDETINGQRYNIHPVAEKAIVQKIIEELAKIEPGIKVKGENKPQQLTKIGSRQLDAREFAILKEIYTKFSGEEKQDEDRGNRMP